MNFANKAKVKTTNDKSGGGGGGGGNTNGNVNFKISCMKKEPGTKIGEKLSELEQIRLRSKSTNDISGCSSDPSKQLPKVDVLKRRSLFENVDGTDSKTNEKTSKEFPVTKSIKERLSNLEKNKEEEGEEINSKTNRSSVEVTPLIKETILNLEKQKSIVECSMEKNRLSTDEIPSQVSIRERLNTLEKQQNDKDGIIMKNKIITTEEVGPVSIKKIVADFDVATTTTTPTTTTTTKEITGKLTPERDAGFKEKLETFKQTEKIQNNHVVNNNNNNNQQQQEDSSKSKFEHLDIDNNNKDKSKTEMNSKIVQNHGQEQPTTVQPDDKDYKTTMAETVSSQKGQQPSCTDTVKVNNNNNNNNQINQETDNNNFKGVKMAEGNSNNTAVGMGSPSDISKITNNRTSSSQTDVTNSSQMMTMMEKSNPSDVSNTIVTQICLPDNSRPRFNISVSLNSISRTIDDDNNRMTNAYYNNDIKTNETKELTNKYNHHTTTTTGTTRNRVRKLTPMITNPKMSTSSLLKTVCELQIIEESENIDRDVCNHDGNKGKNVGDHQNMVSPSKKQNISGDFYEGDNEVQVRVRANRQRERFF